MMCVKHLCLFIHKTEALVNSKGTTNYGHLYCILGTFELLLQENHTVVFPGVSVSVHS